MNTTPEIITSAQSDIDEVPLDENVIIDDQEYARIMRRINGTDANIPVSAFNSSI